MRKQSDPILAAFQYVKAYLFFPRYCPEIRNWKNKMAGRNGRGNPLAFTEPEVELIRKGLKAMANETRQGKRPRLGIYRGRLPATKTIGAEQIGKLFVD